MPKIICIIPARGGSQRLPNKNVMLIEGKPLIAYSIEQAKASKLLQHVFVTTNDTKIEQVALQYGARVIRRPDQLATHEATSESALLHALDEIERTDHLTPDYVVFLQCTSPIRAAGDIDNAINEILRQEADSLFSVTKNERYLWHKINEKWCSLNYDFKKRWRDQDFPEQVRENGSIYVFKPSILRNENNRLGGKIAVYEMDYWSSFQIDSFEHAELCAWILSRGKNKKGQIARGYRLVVSDFDGVMTDNKVILCEDGSESVVCNRSDSMGLAMLKEAGLDVVVLSTERNKVVSARCNKLQIPCYQNVQEKFHMLNEIVKKHSTTLDKVIYLGNDLNDLECMQAVGCSVAVSDAHPKILALSTIILNSRGGQGAFRELCERIVNSWQN